MIPSSYQMILARIVDSLKFEEGYRAHAYHDHLGVLTIGYGRNIDKSGLGISKKEAKTMLENDVRRTAIEVEMNFPWSADLAASQRETLIELAFQMGMPRLLGFKKMLAALEAGDYETAAAELMDSRYATQTPGRAKRYADKIAQ
jgi:lysozyme